MDNQSYKIKLSHSLYYECHITVEPCFGAKLDLLNILCAEFGFKVAKLTMEKGPNQRDSFTTARDNDVNRLVDRTNKLIQSLLSSDFHVWRSKIENCIYDTKTIRPEF